MSKPSVAVILEDDVGLASTVRSIRAAAAGVEVATGSNPAAVVAQAGEGVRLVLVSGSLLAPTLTALKLIKARARVAVLVPETSEVVLELALKNPSVVGLLAWRASGPRNWEVIYLVRRVFASNEAPPHMGTLLPWGATTVAWQPRTTEEQRNIVKRIESMCARLGVERRVGAVVSTAAHELLMNAMYDAPVDARGEPKYALNRAAMLELEDHEVPLLRFTVDGDWLALDVVDSFGRLPRNRFFEGVLRGHRGMTSGSDPILDTSHGGAGLGLHTLYSSGAVLRAELIPLQLTHVSWAFDRTLKRRERRTAARSLFFIPSVRR